MKRKTIVICLLCLLALVAGIFVYAETDLAQPKEVSVSGIEYYAALDDEWQRIDMAHTVPGREVLSNGNYARYYTTPEALEEFYGKLGYTAAQYNTQLETDKAVWFPHTVAGDSAQIWGDATPEKLSDGTWKLPLAKDSKIYVYYLPKGANYQGGKLVLDSDAGEKALQDNMFYSISVSDPDKKIGDDKAELQYVEKGDSYEITLPAADGYQWECLNRKTMEALPEDSFTMTKNGDKVTFRIEHVMQPLKFQPVQPKNTQLKIVYNAATVEDNVQEMGDSSASIQSPVTEATINQQDSFDFYVDPTAAADTDLKILSPDEDQALVEVAGSRQGKKFWYSFNGWRLRGTGRVLTSDSTITLQELQKYEIDGEILLDALWTGKNSYGRIDSANFYVNKKCEISDNMSNGAGDATIGEFTKSIYTAKVDDNYENMSLQNGTCLLLAPEGDNSNAYEVDSEIRNLTKTPVNGVSMESFPSDESVLASLRANYDETDPIKVNEQVIRKEELTAANFTVRWSSVKYQKSDGWHVDGILVAKAGKVIVKKTFAGSADPAIEELKDKFNITVTHQDNPAANGEDEDYKLVLKDKKDQTLQSGETGYDTYDASSHTYTWILTVRDYQQYNIQEHEYDSTTFTRSEHRYTVKNPVENTDGREDEAAGWIMYPEDEGITITADSYEDDMPLSNIQTVELQNLYVSPEFITLDKIDAFTINGMGNVKFQVSKLSTRATTDGLLQLYRRPGTNVYSDYKDSTKEYDFTEKVTDNIIQTDNTGMAYLSLSQGEYIFREKTPVGYQEETAFLLDVVQNTQGGTYIDSVTPCDDEGNKVSGSGDYVSVLGGAGVVTVKNKAEQLTTVTAKANMGDVTADSVKVELWCNGSRLTGGQYTQVLSADNDWSYTWNDLPLYAGGDVAQYTLREIQIGDTSYDAGVNGDGYEDYDVTYGTCKYREGTTGDYNDQATWTDEDGTRHYAKHALVTVNNKKTAIPQQYINVDVQVAWDDGDDQDGIRPGNVNVKLLDEDGNQAGTERSLNEAGHWASTFLQLEKYKDNEEIAYTIDPEKSFAPVPGYTAEVTGDMAAGFVITFRHTPAPVTVSLTGANALKVEKKVEGKASADIYEFQLSAKEDYGTAVVLPENTTARTSGSISAGGNEYVTFDPVTISEEGTYQFQIKETTEATEAGWTYDNEAKTVTVQVEKQGKKLVVTSMSDTPQITNSYQPEPLVLEGDSALKVRKTVEGRNAAEAYHFAVSTAEDYGAKVDLPENTTAVSSDSIRAGASEDISFGTVKIYEEGTYQFKIKETSQATVQGWTYDNTEKTVTVKVEDRNGQLEAVSRSDIPQITNIYQTKSFHLSEVCTIRATNVLYGHSAEAGQFTFLLKAADQTSADKMNLDLSQGRTITSPAAADGETTTILPDLPITLQHSDIGKMYHYTLEEQQAAADGYTYDDSRYQVDIAVKNGGNGVLEAEITVRNTTTNTQIFHQTVSERNPALGENGAAISFENYYKASTEAAGGSGASLTAKKTLTGRSLKAGEFSFVLKTKPLDGSTGETLQTKENQANGAIAFTSLSYKTAADAAGDRAVVLDRVIDGEHPYGEKTVENGRDVYTLHYEVSEEANALPAGVSVQAGSFDITVKVTDHGNGALTAAVQYPDGLDSLNFINTYSTGDPVDFGIRGSKTLNHVNGLDPDSIAEKFTFTLEAVTQGAPMPEKTTAVNDADGNISFGEITYKLSDLADAETAENGSRSRTFEYKVTESGQAAGVTNDSPKTFQVTLTDDGSGHFTVTSDSEQGALFTFTNTYRVEALSSSVTDQVKVMKKLTGRDLKAGEFTFELLENGKAVSGGTNKADGTVTFDPIRYTEPGTHTYLVREVQGDDSDVTYDLQEYMIFTEVIDQGDGSLKAVHKLMTPLADGKEIAEAEEQALVFHNIYSHSEDPSNPGQPGNPGGIGGNGAGGILSGSGAKTGDSSDIALALGLMLIAATAGGILLVRRKMEQ